MSQSHNTISLACLHYLLLLGIDVPREYSPINGEKYPFLYYAAAYWPLHYVSQEAAPLASPERMRVRSVN